MSVGVYLILALVAVLLTGIAVVAWRLWEEYLNKSPAEEAQERDLVSLNDAQANRVSDSQLAHPPDTDDAWRTMVERGKAPPRQPRRRK